MRMTFTDGVSFDTSGPLRIERRHDGLYVVGGGMLIPIATREEGDRFIAMLDAAAKETPCTK